MFACPWNEEREEGSELEHCRVCMNFLGDFVLPTVWFVYGMLGFCRWMRQ